jgi:hypothetical protein
MLFLNLQSIQTLDLNDKTEKLMLSNWSAHRQRFYISEVNNTTYTTVVRKIKKKTEYEYITCRFCSKNKDTYQHWKTDCSNKKIKNIFKEEKSLLSTYFQIMRENNVHGTLDTHLTFVSIV